MVGPTHSLGKSGSSLTWATDDGIQYTYYTYDMSVMLTLHVIVSLVSVMCEPHDWTRWERHYGGFYATKLLYGVGTVVGPLIALCVVSKHRSISGAFNGPTNGPPILHRITYPKMCIFA